jgi:excinuclease ABC subunit B
MYEGDRSRKTTLVEYGFRLPSALDNRPLRFDEFMDRTRQKLYVSATPSGFEISNSRVGNTGYVPFRRARPGEGREEAPPAPPRLARVSGAAQPVEAFDVHTPGADLVVEQIIRPTGLLDPVVRVRPLKGQIDATIELCRDRIERGQRVLVTTLTKRTAEDLTDYLRDLDFRVRYIHADVDAIERVEILRSLRSGECDVLVGINLLREGLDLPEVSLVCILDADKEGYLRSETSLVQTAGRAARHEEGEVVLFADQVTGSIQRLLDISENRRLRQAEHNEAHGITPTSVRRAVQASLQLTLKGQATEEAILADDPRGVDVVEVLRELEAEMAEAAAKLEFERAALLRDQINALKDQTGEAKIGPRRRGDGKGKRASYSKGRK